MFRKEPQHGKYCPKCDKVKPLSEFYPSKQNKDGRLTYCKTHHKEICAIYKVRGSVPHFNEAEVKRLLNNQGIYTIFGKNDNQSKWVDLVSWGCVHIEVKSSKYRRNGYSWATGNTIDKIRGHVVVLCGVNSDYYVFPSSHPIFYDNEGLLKDRIIYRYDRDLKTARNRSGKALSDEDMLPYLNRWELIEDIRRKISEDLMKRPTDKADGE
jgi:hypothetical protein